MAKTTNLTNDLSTTKLRTCHLLAKAGDLLDSFLSNQTSSNNADGLVLDQDALK